MPVRKNVLVTGATGAIGRAIARNISVKNGYRVIAVARNEDKARSLVEEINSNSPAFPAEYLIANLSSLDEIISLASKWDDPLHVLINNAATAPRNRQENSEGIELQFATNVLGYFRMINAFHRHLKKETPSRIVNVASYWAGGLDMSDPEFKKRRYDNDAAYRQSKQADRMLSAAFAQRMKEDGISVNACHPGDVNSQLSNSLGFGGHESPDQGASTPVWLATDPVGINNTGKYFEHRRETACRFSTDKNAVDKLFDLCEKYDA